MYTFISCVKNIFDTKGNFKDCWPSKQTCLPPFSIFKCHTRFYNVVH